MSAKTPAPGHGRREFLSRVGGTTAAAAALAGALPAPVAAHGDDDVQHFRDVHGMSPRAREAFEVRLKAALFQMRRGTSQHRSNGDERRYEKEIGSFSKFLPHDANGEVDGAAFAALVHAMRTADPADFELIPLGGAGKLVNPQAGFAFGFSARTRRPTPVRVRRDSPARKRQARWWSCIGRRDARRALRSVRHRSDDCGGVRGTVGPERLPRPEDWRRRDAGQISGDRPAGVSRSRPSSRRCCGSRSTMDLPGRSARRHYAFGHNGSNADYLWDYMEWLTVQNGGAPPRPQQFVGTTRRYIITARDSTEWLHRDFSHQGGTNAVFILMANGVLGLAPGNPYVTSRTQLGNFTLGGSQILDSVASIANNALQACWFHKWSVDRKVRPEEFGGFIDNKLTLGLPRPIHRRGARLGSAGALAREARDGAVAEAFAEGCPVHPAYPSGHSAFCGAWGTILKAFFNTEAVIANPVVPDATD